MAQNTPRRMFHAEYSHIRKIHNLIKSNEKEWPMPEKAYFNQLKSVDTKSLEYTLQTL